MGVGFHAFLESPMSVRSQLPLMFQMICRVGKQLEIFYSVIVLNAVDVMHLFLRFQSSSQMLLHYVLMFKQASSRGEFKDYIASRVSIFSQSVGICNAKILNAVISFYAVNMFHPFATTEAAT